LRALGDDGVRHVVEGYMDAMAQGDVSKVVSLLAEDAAWSMPPLPAWFTGRDELVGFLEYGPLSGDWKWRHRPAWANGQPAVGSYAWHPGEGTYLPFALDVMALDGDRIKEITSFICRSTKGGDPDYYVRWPEQPVDLDWVEAFFGRFGLPGRIDD
jgi:RNA polymerase sigma-70 factor (ECF subfamily)